MKRLIVLATLGAVVVLAAIGLVYFDDMDAPSPDAAGDRPATESADAPGKSETDDLTAPALAREPAAPSFDVVRINPKGDTVIAGRAAPGAVVTILDGDRVIGRVTADSRGEWVFVPEKPLPPGSREFSLVARGPDDAERRSESTVVLAVPDSARTGTGETPGAIAVRVPRPGSDDASRVLQHPTATGGGGGGLADGALTLDVIEYGADGRLVLSGTAPAGGAVRAALDDRLLGTGPVDGDGNWTLAPVDPVAPGLYRLRVDLLDAGGAVLARIETPFSRAGAIGDIPSGTVVVQPGNSLWRIARRVCGEGLRYTMIYDRNKAQIADPDLIYPGQIFTLPPVN